MTITLPEETLNALLDRRDDRIVALEAELALLRELEAVTRNTIVPNARERRLFAKLDALRAKAGA